MYGASSSVAAVAGNYFSSSYRQAAYIHPPPPPPSRTIIVCSLLEIDRCNRSMWCIILLFTVQARAYERVIALFFGGGDLCDLATDEECQKDS